jgi:hypothetical protein
MLDTLRPNFKTSGCSPWNDSEEAPARCQDRWRGLAAKGQLPVSSAQDLLDIAGSKDIEKCGDTRNGGQLTALSLIEFRNLLNR